jgi:hypothetical protein
VSSGLESRVESETYSRSFGVVQLVLESAGVMESPASGTNVLSTFCVEQMSSL